MSHAMNNALFESLEGRRLLCGSAASSSATTTPVATAALVAKPAVLTSAQVIGHYKGNAVVTGIGSTIPLKLTITKTAAKLTVTGYGTTTITLSAKSFNRIRDGKFSFTAAFGSTTFALTGTVTKSGTLISGTFSGTGSTPVSGTFSMKKY